MAEVVLNLGGNFKEGVSQAATGWSEFVTGLNQGLQLVKSVGGQAIALLNDAFTTAGQFEGLSTGLSNLAGSADEAAMFMDKMGTASHGTLGSMDAMRLANNALMLGVVKNSGEMGQLTKMAASLGHALGIDTAKAVESLTIGIGRQSKLWLDNLGILVDVEKAYDDYAVTLNKTSKELTDAEKKQAFINAAFAAGNELMKETGEFTLTATQSWSKLKTQIEESNIALSRMTADTLGPTIELLAEMAEQTAGNLGFLADLNSEVERNVDASSAQAIMLSETGTKLDTLGPITRRLVADFKALNDIVEHFRSLHESAETVERFIERVNKQYEAHATTLAEASRVAREQWMQTTATTEAIEDEADAVDAANAAFDKWHEEFYQLDKETEEATEETEQLIDAQAKLAKMMGMSGDAASLLGDSAVEALGYLAPASKEAINAFLELAESGEKSAGDLLDVWQNEVLPGLIGSSQDIGAVNQAISDDLLAKMGDDVQTWIDDTKATLEAEGGSIADPISDAVEEGFNEADLSGFTDGVGEQLAMSFADALGNPDALAMLQQAMSDAIGTVTVGGSSSGIDFLNDPNAEIGPAQQAMLKKLFQEAKASGNTEAQQAIEAAINAFEQGDAAFAEKTLQALQSDLAYIGTYFKKTEDTREKMDELGEAITFLTEAMAILGLGGSLKPGVNAALLNPGNTGGSATQSVSIFGKEGEAITKTPEMLKAIAELTGASATATNAHLSAIAAVLLATHQKQFAASGADQEIEGLMAGAKGKLGSALSGLATGSSADNPYLKAIYGGKGGG